jgi:hypothetical protein
MIFSGNFRAYVYRGRRANRRLERRLVPGPRSEAVNRILGPACPGLSTNKVGRWASHRYKRRFILQPPFAKAIGSCHRHKRRTNTIFENFRSVIFENHKKYKIFYLTRWIRKRPGSNLLPPSQNICALRFIIRLIQKIMKMLFICYDMFYHLIYFKYILIIFTLSHNFLNKTSGRPRLVP